MNFPRLRSAWYGLTLPATALKLILAHRTLLIMSILPIIITTVLYFYVIRAAQTWAGDQLQGMFISFGLDDNSWIAVIVGLLAQLLIFLVSALTFVFASSIVASPFNDFLAEKAETKSDPPIQPVESTGLGNQLKLMWIDLVKTGAAIVAGIAAFLFSLFPIVNIITFAVAFLLVSFQYISYPQTRRGLNLRQSAMFLRRHMFACAGFGASISFLFAIPVLSVFVLPVAVVGGTVLFARAQVTPPGQFQLK